MLAPTYPSQERAQQPPGTGAQGRSLSHQVCVNLAMTCPVTEGLANATLGLQANQLPPFQIISPRCHVSFPHGNPGQLGPVDGLVVTQVLSGALRAYVAACFPAAARAPCRSYAP